MLDNCAKDMQRDFDRIMLANNYNMKEIHKSEILEKLALGWKVRCKVWKAGEYADKGWPISTLLAYLTDNNSWEAEPPKPAMRCINSGLWLEDAIGLIRMHKCRVIRSEPADGSYGYTLGWHNDDALWHLDIEKDMQPLHPAAFYGDDGMFCKKKWSVFILE